MNRLPKILMPSGILILALLLLTVFLASCGEDDPVVPVVTNHAPTAPAINTGAGAPADQAVDIALGAQLHWTCTDPDDDPLTYTVRFGTAAEPPAVAQDQAAASYTPAGLVNATTYYWQVIAADDAAKATSSPVWSFTTVAATNETVSTPATPNGPAAATTGEVPSYSTTGAISSEGHALEYRFDWGDGTQSVWGSGAGVSYTWTAAGTYDVKAQARCAVDTAIESVWSSATSVAITVPVGEFVYSPLPPTGPISGTSGEVLAYATSGGSSTFGHTLEYRFDWSDGTTSDWGVGMTASHAWTASGLYSVRAQTRCQLHPSVESSLSAFLSVSIDMAETVSRPRTPQGDTPIEIGVSEIYTVTGSSSSQGHVVEYRMDWGNGTMSDWGIYSFSNAWDTDGVYEVKGQARCIEHPDVVSDWTYMPLAVTVLAAETVTAPDAPDGPVAVTTLDNPLYSFAAGAVSSRDHTLEYRIDWGDGEVRGWGTSTGGYHQWGTVGTYNLVAQARCKDHPTVESDWSVATAVVVSVPAEVVGDAYIGSHPSVGGIDELLEFSIASGNSNLDHPTELQIDWGDGTFSDWGPKVGLHYIRSHAWTAAGTYQVTARARCIEHPAIMSDWVTAVPLEIIGTETVSVPSMSPTGEVTYDLDYYVNVTAMFSQSNLDHSVEYQFEVNGTLSDWDIYGSERLASDVPADYVVRVHARCAEHPDVVSDWTETVLIHIVDLENISTPTLSGPATGTVGVPVQFTVSGAVSTFGDELEYQLLWSRFASFQSATIMEWASADNLIVTWDAPEPNLFVLVNTRCAVHPDVTANQATSIQLSVVE